MRLDRSGSGNAYHHRRQVKTSAAVLPSPLLLATEWLKNKTIDEALQIDNNMDIVEELALPPVKIHCSVLAEDAIKAAIQDYRKKQAARTETGRKNVHQ